MMRHVEHREVSMRELYSKHKF